MLKTLAHIYGPFSINSFGTMIVLGLVVFTWLVLRNPATKKIVSPTIFLDALALSIGLALIGGRALYLLTEFTPLNHPTEIFMFWSGGFSVLGSIVAIVIFLPLYLRSKSVPVLPFLDLVGLNAPVLQAISRIGCFLAGCCHGAVTRSAWSITYIDTESIAPLYVSLYPTQLYSALCFIILFIFMYGWAHKHCQKPGQLFFIYLALASMERLSIDFLRGDRDYFCSPVFVAFSFLSINQWLALVIFVSALLSLVYITFFSRASS